jgi:hypothetical protein
MHILQTQANLFPNSRTGSLEGLNVEGSHLAENLGGDPMVTSNGADDGAAEVFNEAAQQMQVEEVSRKRVMFAKMFWSFMVL